MSRLAQRFADLKAAGRTALIPFVTAGDPNPELTVPLMHAMVANGADVIELGVPFSDPMADGPVNKRSAERALANGVGLAAVLGMVREFRKQDPATPVVLMGYANPVEAMGSEKFVAAAGDAGVDGVIVVDYPPEEAIAVAALAKSSGVDAIFLLAPTSTPSRIEKVGRIGSGYLYYVSLKGVTGAASIDLSDVEQRMPLLRAATKLPIGVGFGIRDAQSARRVADLADAVVIGSRIIQEIEAAGPDQALDRVRDLLRPIRAALDA